MATVQQMKDALKAEQDRSIDLADHALDLADQSFSAIGQITMVSSVAIGALTLLIAIIAVFGFTFLQKRVEEVAKAGLDSYMKSKDFHDRMSLVVRKEIAKRAKIAEQLKNMGVAENLDPEQDDEKPDPFSPEEDAK